MENVSYILMILHISHKLTLSSKTESTNLENRNKALKRIHIAHWIISSIVISFLLICIFFWFFFSQVVLWKNTLSFSRTSMSMANFQLIFRYSESSILRLNVFCSFNCLRSSLSNIPSLYSGKYLINNIKTGIDLY